MPKKENNVLIHAKYYIHAALSVSSFLLFHFIIHMNAIDELGNNYSTYYMVKWAMTNYWWLIVNLLFPLSLFYFFKNYNSVKSYSKMTEE